MSVERRPAAQPRRRAPRTDHPFRPVDDEPEAVETAPAPAPQPEPEPAPVTPPPPAQAAPEKPYDPPVAIGGRGPQSVRTRLKVWCAARNEPMDRVLVRAITEFLDRNGG